MNKSEAGKLGAKKAAETAAKAKEERIRKYDLNPKKCLYCGSPLPYKKRHNKFCNQSCSASYTNCFSKLKHGRYCYKDDVNDQVKKLREERKETVHCLNCGKDIGNKRHKTQKYCNSKCQHEWHYKKAVEEWKRGKKTGLKGEYLLANFLRKYMLEKAHYKCERCGWGEKNPYTGKYVLEIHHKDGDYTNNTEENLEVLCLNCHGMTENYKSRNKNGRKGRKKYSE